MSGSSHTHRGRLQLSSVGSPAVVHLFVCVLFCPRPFHDVQPKLKYYIECSGHTAEEAAALTKKMSDAIIGEFIQPSENQLEAPKREA